MASQAVNEILAVEKEARSALQNAQDEAQELINSAHAQGKSLLMKEQQDAQKQADAMLQSARSQAQTIRSQKAGEAQKQAEALRQSVLEKQKKAVDTAVSLIIPELQQ